MSDHVPERSGLETVTAIATADRVSDADPIDAGAAVPAAPEEFSLRVAPDKLSVLLDCSAPGDDPGPLVERILSECERLELAETPDGAALAALLADADDGDLVDFPVLRGQAPVPPRDASLEWSREYFTQGWAIDEDSGAIDFWQKLEDLSVNQDDLLVRLLPAVPGEPGLNVYGNKIPVDKPKRAKLRPGKGVRVSETEDGIQDFFADIDGRIRHTDGTVAVDDVYVIKGGVSLETGNVKHAGALVIEGDVAACATVEAQGDIVIKGMVEPCTILCGGSLTVGGGLLGGPEYRIEVAGGLQAKYISEAVIRAGGDVVAHNEISHSDIRTLGRVLVPKGRIAGGQTIALRGIRVREAGSSGSAETHLTAGLNYRLDELLAEPRAKLEQIETALGKIREALKAADQREAALTARELEIATGLKTKEAQLERAVTAQEAVIKQAARAAHEQAVLEIVMLEELWSGTRIQLGKAQAVVRNSVLKPRLARLSKKKVCILPLGEGNMPQD